MKSYSRLVSVSIIAMCSVATATFAEEVELISPDGLVAITGTILANDGTLLTVDAGYTTLRIPVADVECRGAACPPGVTLVSSVSSGADLEMSFQDSHARTLMLDLLEDRAVARSSDLKVELDGETARLLSSRDDLLASLAFLPEGSTGGDVRVTMGPIAAPAGATIRATADWATTGEAATRHLAQTALAVITAPDIGVSTISIEDLARVFAGEITNWSELGGNSVAIQPIEPASGSRVYDAFMTQVMDPFGAEASSNVIRSVDDTQLPRLVPNFPGAISVVTVAMAAEAAPLSISDACGAPIAPSQFAVNLDQYPLTMATQVALGSDTARDAMAPFLDAVVTSDVPQSLGYFDERVRMDDGSQSAERVSALLQGNLSGQSAEIAKGFVERIFGARQLSVNFQDGPVAGAVGAKNRADFAHLKTAIEAGLLDDHDIMFVGFAATGTDAFADVAAAQEAATSIQAAFQDYAADILASRPGVTFSASGHGTFGLTSCLAQITPNSRNLVEVWVRPQP